MSQIHVDFPTNAKTAFQRAWSSLLPQCLQAHLITHCLEAENWYLLWESCLCRALCLEWTLPLLNNVDSRIWRQKVGGRPGGTGSWRFRKHSVFLHIPNTEEKTSNLDSCFWSYFDLDTSQGTIDLPGLNCTREQGLQMVSPIFSMYHNILLCFKLLSSW